MARSLQAKTRPKTGIVALLYVLFVLNPTSQGFMSPLTSQRTTSARYVRSHGPSALINGRYEAPCFVSRSFSITYHSLQPGFTFTALSSSFTGGDGAADVDANAEVGNADAEGPTPSSEPNRRKQRLDARRASKSVNTNNGQPTKASDSHKR